jgi:hypothetical protein
LVATTPESRSICNDPLLFGLAYTNKLRIACGRVLKQLTLPIEEQHTCVVHLLRGGLNFGLREALGEAYGWHRHGSTFLSAQRRRKNGTEEWEIGESEYQKFVTPNPVSFVLGDVVASGASLEYGITTLLDEVERREVRLRSIVLFTIGGPRAQAVLAEAEDRIRASHPSYEGTHIVYLEGRFPVATPETPLRIKETGTDLLRHGDDLAPEFVESQYENPMFPVERCTIYDAGSRAFEPRIYLQDVLDYWRKVGTFHGEGFTSYLEERCPCLDPSRFKADSLGKLAKLQCERLEKELAWWG